MFINFITCSGLSITERIYLASGIPSLIVLVILFAICLGFCCTGCCTGNNKKTSDDEKGKDANKQDDPKPAENESNKLDDPKPEPIYEELPKKRYDTVICYFAH